MRSPHWFKGNSYILSEREIKSPVTQASLTCVSVLTIIAFKNRCNVSVPASTDWLLQPDQVLWHCEDRHHDLCSDWVLWKRFSAGKEFCVFPSTPHLSNFKERKIICSVSDSHATAVDYAIGDRFLMFRSLSLAYLSPDFSAVTLISLKVLSSQSMQWGASKGVQAELCPGKSSRQHLYCFPYWEHIMFPLFSKP